VAGSEPVTSPDQHKPGHRKGARIGAVAAALAMLAMLVGNNDTATGAPFLITGAGLLLGALGLDWALRRRGLRSGD